MEIKSRLWKISLFSCTFILFNFFVPKKFGALSSIKEIKLFNKTFVFFSIYKLFNFQN